MFPTLSLSQLKTASAAIRADGDQAACYNEYKEYAEAGETVSVTLANGDVRTAMLVDASQNKGLVFMFIDYIYHSPVFDEDGNNIGWSTAELRTKLNSGVFYTTYFDGMTINGEEVNLVPVPLSSLEHKGKAEKNREVRETADNKIWIPSVVELYGTWDGIYQPNYPYSGDEGCTQFLYYKKLGVTPSANYSVLSRGTNAYWSTRSASDDSRLSFIRVTGAGKAEVASGTSFSIRFYPCFCL